MENVETFQYYDTQVLTLRYLDPGLAPTLRILSSQRIQNAQSFESQMPTLYLRLSNPKSQTDGFKPPAMGIELITQLNIQHF